MKPTKRRKAREWYLVYDTQLNQISHSSVIKEGAETLIKDLVNCGFKKRVFKIIKVREVLKPRRKR